MNITAKCQYYKEPLLMFALRQQLQRWLTSVVPHAVVGDRAAAGLLLVRRPRVGQRRRQQRQHQPPRALRAHAADPSPRTSTTQAPTTSNPRTRHALSHNNPAHLLQLKSNNSSKLQQCLSVYVTRSKTKPEDYAVRIIRVERTLAINHRSGNAGSLSHIDL